MNAELEKRVTSLPVLAGEIRIQDQASLSKANEFLLIVKGLQREVNQSFDPIIEAAHKAHKEALAQKKKHEEPLLLAERTVKSKINVYLTEEERKREEESFKARQAELDKRKNEQDALDAAAAAEAKGDNETASFILENAAAAENKIVGAIPAIPTPKPIVNGLSRNPVWRFEITDPAAVPREYLTVDLVKIGKVVRELKGNTKIPGVLVIEDKAIAVRAS